VHCCLPLKTVCCCAMGQLASCFEDSCRQPAVRVISMPLRDANAQEQLARRTSCNILRCCVHAPSDLGRSADSSLVLHPSCWIGKVLLRISSYCLISCGSIRHRNSISIVFSDACQCEDGADRTPLLARPCWASPAADAGDAIQMHVVQTFPYSGRKYT
jgi:hypothetical protein